ISFLELMEARIIVEPELAARAATRATEDQITALQVEMNEMRQCAGNSALLSRHDLQFHQVIFDAAGNRLCNMMFTVIHQKLHGLIETTSQMVTVEHTLHFHQRIFSAIRRREPDEARKRMSEHLLDAKGLLERANDRRQTTRLQSRITEISNLT